jgi:hypothetical protein
MGIDTLSENRVLISLSIPADEYIRVYQGSAKKVSAIDHRGRRISFPVNILQPFVTRDGVIGGFEIYFDQDNRFQKIIRLS